MAVQAYAAKSSVVHGDDLAFDVNDDSGGGINATLVVSEFVTESEKGRLDVHVDANPTPDHPAADRGWPIGFRTARPLTSIRRAHALSHCCVGLLVSWSPPTCSPQPSPH